MQGLFQYSVPSVEYWSLGKRLNLKTARKNGGLDLHPQLTAAFLAAELQIPGELRHPEYIARWLEVLGGDKWAIFTAASKATKAANYMRQFDCDRRWFLGLD